MSITIQSDVNTLQELNTEIKSAFIHINKLKKQRKQIEDRIQDYLNAQNLPGIKYKGVVIIRKDKTTHKRKKKKDLEDDSISILRKYNISEPKKVLGELIEARKGSPIPNNKLILKKINES